MQKSSGILFLGGAKRVSMARKFMSAAAERDISLHIYGSEILRPVPLECIGEIIDHTRWNDPEICTHLLALCREYNIHTIVPFVDPAVKVAACVAAMSDGGVFAPTGSPEDADTMFDKVAANDIFTRNGLPVPPVYDPAVPLEPQLPLIAKPRHGSASKGIIAIDSPADMAMIEGQENKYLIQRRIDRRRELTVDCYVRMSDGVPCAIIPRIRDEVAGGEVTRTTVIHSDRVTSLARRILAATDLRGAVTIQLIHDLDTDNYLIMEINPRLGGGAVSAVLAGADIPGMILDEAFGIIPTPADKYYDIVVTRYLDEVAFPYEQR